MAETVANDPPAVTPMQLILAIVQDEDAGLAIEALTAANFRATRINTIGGFLRKGNATILVATAASEVQRALLILRDNCEQRTEYFVPTAPGEIGEPYPLDPIPVQVGGATIFVLDLERLVRLGDEEHSWENPQQKPGRKLIWAIVLKDDVARAVKALVEHGHWVTRINTVGGFLRRGNVTLLMGVEAEQVGAVIETLRRECQASQANQELLAPHAQAVVIVVDSPGFLQV